MRPRSAGQLYVEAVGPPFRCRVGITMSQDFLRNLHFASFSTQLKNVPERLLQNDLTGCKGSNTAGHMFPVVVRFQTKAANTASGHQRQCDESKPLTPP